MDQETGVARFTGFDLPPLDDFFAFASDARSEGLRLVDSFLFRISLLPTRKTHSCCIQAVIRPFLLYLIPFLFTQTSLVASVRLFMYICSIT